MVNTQIVFQTRLIQRDYVLYLFSAGWDGVRTPGGHLLQLHIEEEENEPEQSRAESVTQPSDPCDHALNCS